MYHAKIQYENTRSNRYFDKLNELDTLDTLDILNMNNYMYCLDTSYIFT
jgi:hypothetical protein